MTHASAEVYLAELELRAHRQIEDGSETLAAIEDLRTQLSTVTGKKDDSNVRTEPPIQPGATLPNLDALNWRTNSKGWWIFADDCKPLKEKIGPQKGNVFRQDKWEYQISYGKEGKEFLNRTMASK